jgi:predicted extracellular nuclease
MKRIWLYLIALTLGCSCTNTKNSGKPMIRISDIQGCGHVSPYTGKEVSNIKGVVTHKFDSGFTMQSIEPDSMDCSSEGLYVFTGEYSTVLLGQYLRVDGTVAEFTAGSPDDHNLSRTELHPIKITVLNEKVEMPSPVVIGNQNEFRPEMKIDTDGLKRFDTKQDGIDYYESLESMLVSVETGVVVGPKNQHNEFIVIPEKFLSSNIFSNNGSLMESESDENPERIIIYPPKSFTQKVKVGDKLLEPIIGIMDYSYGNYKIWTIKNPTVETTKVEIDSIPVPDEKVISIVSINVNNLSIFDETKKYNQLSHQIVHDLKSPDIVVMHEVLDDSGIDDDGTVTADKTLQRLVTTIFETSGTSYKYSDSPPINNADGGIPGGNIRTTVLFRNDRGLVLEKEHEGSQELLLVRDRFSFPTNPLRIFSDETSFSGTRKPTLWNFTWNGEQIVIVGAHLVSQNTDSPDWGKLQPPEKPDQPRREAQATLVFNYLESLILLKPNLNVVIVGDFNDMKWSPLITEYPTNSLINLNDFEESSELYSYIYYGNATQLDYAFYNRSIQNRIQKFTILHINSQFSIDSQVSDHDPLYLLIKPD